jgi:hypothetical protein
VPPDAFSGLDSSSTSDAAVIEPAPAKTRAAPAAVAPVAKKTTPMATRIGEEQVVEALVERHLARGLGFASLVPNVARARAGPGDGLEPEDEDVDECRDGGEHETDDDHGDPPVSELTVSIYTETTGLESGVDAVARSREFDRVAVVRAARQFFWEHGYEDASIAGSRARPA